MSSQLLLRLKVEEPTGKRLLHGLQVSGEKVIGAGEEYELFRFGRGAGHLRSRGRSRSVAAGAVFSVRALPAHQQFAAGHTGGESAGHLELPGAAAVEQ